MEQREKLMYIFNILCVQDLHRQKCTISQTGREIWNLGVIGKY